MLSPTSSPPPVKMPLLKELEVVAKQSWRLILGCAAIGFAIAVLDLRGKTYSYPVEMQASTVQATTSGPSMSGNRMSQLSSLANLANISMPTTQNEIQFQFFVDSLRSRDLADEIAKNHEIMLALYGGQWDPATQTWVEPPTGTQTKIKLWLRNLLGLAPTPPWHAPNGEEIKSFLDRSLEVLQDPRKNYMVTLKLVTGDRAFSARFLDVLVKTADDRLRQKALARARDYIGYLTSKLNTVTVAEHRDALTAALGEQERYAMVASSGKPFAAEVFQSPWASNLPASPSPRQVFLVWMFLGAAAALSFAFARRRYHCYLQSAAWVQRLPGFIRRPLLAG